MSDDVINKSFFLLLPTSFTSFLFKSASNEYMEWPFILNVCYASVSNEDREKNDCSLTVITLNIFIKQKFCFFIKFM